MKNFTLRPLAYVVVYIVSAAFLISSIILIATGGERWLETLAVAIVLNNILSLIQWFRGEK